MSNIKVFENDNAYFEDNIPKQDDYKMSKELNPFFKDIVMSIERFTSDEQLKDYLTYISFCTSTSLHSKRIYQIKKSKK